MSNGKKETQTGEDALAAHDGPDQVSPPMRALALPNADTCAFRAHLSASEASRSADQTIELSMKLDLVTVEMLEAVIAARQARRAADEAERAATDSRYRNAYESAKAAYHEALGEENRASLALRRLKERLPELQVMAAAGASEGTQEAPSGKHFFKHMQIV